MFASPEQISNNRPSALCDIFSLVCVAYVFVNGTLPWVLYMNRIAKTIKEPNYKIDLNTFMHVRTSLRQKFDISLIKQGGELSPLFEYLLKQRTKQNKQQI